MPMLITAYRKLDALALLVGEVSAERVRNVSARPVVRAIISRSVSIAGIVVFIAYPGFFAQNLVAPVDRVYVATIKAGASADVAWSLTLWAIPGAIIQFLGGPRRQLGVLLSTGLLIPFPLAGWRSWWASPVALCGNASPRPKEWRFLAPV